MNSNQKFSLAAGTVVLAAVIGVAASSCDARKDATTKNSEASVVTNDNGSVSRSFTECTVTTNGSLVTEHRRETRTTLDTDGNLLETSTSEYAQSYPVGETALKSLMQRQEDSAEAPAATESFLGLKFGEEFSSTNFVQDADEPTLLRANFVPKKPLAAFDDYYVYVTPTTHKVAKVYACAKAAVEPGARWRRHYLIEALEKRYQTWARLCSYRRPCYAFDLGSGRYVTACLAGASDTYETVLAGWDETVLKMAADENEARREAARKAAAESRNRRVRDAADAF